MTSSDWNCLDVGDLSVELRKHDVVYLSYFTKTNFIYVLIENFFIQFNYWFRKDDESN